jgi:hypothetical protein
MAAVLYIVKCIVSTMNNIFNIATYLRKIFVVSNECDLHSGISAFIRMLLRPSLAELARLHELSQSGIRYLYFSSHHDEFKWHVSNEFCLR